MLQVVRMASDANQKRVLIMSESVIIPKRINGHAERVPIHFCLLPPEADQAHDIDDNDRHRNHIAEDRLHPLFDL